MEAPVLKGHYNMVFCRNTKITVVEASVLKGYYNKIIRYDDVTIVVVVVSG